MLIWFSDCEIYFWMRLTSKFGKEIIQTGSPSTIVIWFSICEVLFSVDLRRVEGFPWIEIGAVLFQIHLQRVNLVRFVVNISVFSTTRLICINGQIFNKKREISRRLARRFRDVWSLSGIIGSGLNYVISIKSFSQAGLRSFIAVQPCVAVALVAFGKWIHRPNIGLRFITNIFAWYCVAIS